MAFDTIIGTRANNLPILAGSIPDSQIVIVPDPTTGALKRTTFGQIKSDIIVAIGAISYLDQIIEVPTVADLPQPGAIKTIYVITSGPDINTQWRWGGSIYIEFPQGSGDVASEAILRGNADDELQANIDAEAATRAAADTILQNNINTEAISRANADTTLTNKVNNEINTRTTADASLQGLINAEGVTRLQADNDLQSNIDDEAAARDTADTLLSNRIDEIEAGAGVSKTYVDTADQALSDRIDAIQPAPSPTGSRIISGCQASWSGSGLTFDDTPGQYEIQGVPYNFPGGSVTLDPADPTLPRFDVLALDDQEQLVKITGTPGANPDIPQVDPSSQLYLTAIYVDAGAVTPTLVDQSIIYSENTEWTGATNGMTANFNDTTSPFSGTKDINVTAAVASSRNSN